MNTSTFIQNLVSNTAKDLQFTLPDQTKLSGDLHITEIQNHNVDSVDCEGNMHQYVETVVQLWINEASKDVAEWRTEKALQIFEIVGKKIDFKDDAELFIEFGDTVHPTIKYSVREIESNGEEVNVVLMVKPTACKPKLNLEATKMGACC
ncbi:DUF6428 family protein [Gracilimonas tropica]|uniref:DUF6428 family protein n=1 Tax=Gracilimonas tropica TaxID=454600 RepID=UPI000369DA85|nr:DUF6428 family protein [Gracilimonas tropica]